MKFAPLKLNMLHFPFPVQLHLKLFIEHWRSVIAQGTTNVSEEIKHTIEETLRAHPFLLEPIGDLQMLDDFQEFLRLLFAQMFPHESLGPIQGVTAPFYHRNTISATETYNKVVELTDENFQLLDITANKERLDYRALYAYKLILKKFYDLDMKVDQPVISSLFDQQTGLRRYYKLTGGMKFLEVFNLAELPHFDDRMLQTLLDQRFDMNLWMKALPPDQFLFSGVTLVSMIDITIEEATTRLQYMLLNRQYNDASWFDSVEKEMRNLFRLPDLRLGVAAMQVNGEMNFNSKHPLWNSLLLRELGGDATWLKGSAYDEVLQSDQTIIIEDLKQHQTDRNPFGTAALKAGYRNLLLTPLIYGERIIGILELASPEPGQINGLSMFKILQIKSIFVNAVKHHVDEFENKVEAIMLEEYTSIHPAIRWRFRDAAIALLDRKGVSMSQDIYFEHVYPFYGSLDVRNSSRKQSAAIERDLLYHLELAHDILNMGHSLLSFDILGELMSSVEMRIERLREAFSSGDDLATADFIRKELTPVILHLREQHPQIHKLTDRYIEFSSSETGICTINRTAYEAALSLVNIAMIKCLESEEEALQKLSPCYFEKFRTDGVEYNIYAGPSISPGRYFDQLYLDNLRLRQLLWTCNIVQQTAQLQPEIRELFAAAWRATLCQSLADANAETRVEIAPLILAYGGTITLKFRPDEKRLDVEGAYNVRYEIMKKRLDKAAISGTQERLTQPGHIAIVYTGDREAEIYTRHLEYLATKGHIQHGWEYLELEPLQGVKGLKAIRAQVA